MRLISLSLIFFLLSCSSIHLRLKSEYQTQNNQVGEFIYEKSYDTKTIMWACIVTGIFYGGACWVYTMMPMTVQESNIVADAQYALRDRLGVPQVEVINPVVDKDSWDNKPTELKVYPKSALLNPQTPGKPPESPARQTPLHKTVPRQKLQDTDTEDDFLR